LKRDLPDYKAGEIFEWDGKYYKAQNKCREGTYGRWPDYYVTNSDWFELIPEQEERLYTLSEIKSCCHDDSAGGGTLYLSWDRLLNLKK
jgi:hypothetical protein